LDVGSLDKKLDDPHLLGGNNAFQTVAKSPRPRRRVRLGDIGRLAALADGVRQSADRQGEIPRGVGSKLPGCIIERQ
jgi:hypothetical protein